MSTMSAPMPRMGGQPNRSAAPATGQTKRVGPNIYRDRESWARFSRPSDSFGAAELVRVFLAK